uniref:Protein kinase domain-containing protein n=1 Tax=Rhizophagus irregularis (strain DAOM 181602 / DAOM 197198 / MUCL 43194) TaxID=747089 RepID=U9UPD6_RHIID
MVVLDFNKCGKCNYTCTSIHFQRNFKNWISGNNDIDKFIQNTQLSAHNYYNVRNALEWIPYGKLYDIKYITEDNKFGKVYRANWIDGCIYKWNDENQNWIRGDQNMFVILKILNNSASITLNPINKIAVPSKVYGITQDPETKNYMVVLENICEKCNKVCNAIHFQNRFIHWTSGNDDIDKFIQDTQLTAHTYNEEQNALEWIPYDRFYDIKYIAKGGFGKVYKAKWDDHNQNWIRKDQNMVVALKSLNNSRNVALEFMNEITLHHKVNLHKRFIKLYGITQDPETENYIMVLDYAENGSLRNYLDTNYSKLSWSDKINYLHSIAHGLKDIHEIELIHRDLHIGNILRLKNLTCITDMGLCKPADCNTSENAKSKIYGILPYIAPEILRGQNYTKAADIYSFGIVMYEVISGLPPYYDVGHDINLTMKICKGLRPRFNIKVPHLIVHLIKRCLDANQSKRPNAEEIKKTLSKWLKESSDLLYISNLSNYTSIQKQIKEIDESSSNSSITSTNLGISYVTNSEAVYASRLLEFSNLPEPKNSDDYYEVNDNIISMKFSESLQIDISQLKNSNSFELKNSDDSYEKNDNINMKPSESLQIDILQSPEPDNSDDSYEKNDNIISMNSSAESLQIDIYQLNTSKDDQDRKSKGKEKI